MSPHQGNIALPTKATVGFLHQDMSIPKGKTVIEETMSVLSDMLALEQEIEAINHQIEHRTDYESDDYLSLFDQLNELNDRFQLLGGHTKSAEAEKILKGLGFNKNDFTRNTSELSGGWQMRVELAKMLLHAPDYLLLDEPTNHLDIESILWLEDFLKTYEGSVVMISHDRTFLDNVTKRILEIESASIYDYRANYTKFLVLREERRSNMLNAYENQQREIARKEQLIDKFRAKATKAKMAQSLIKELGRMEKVELDLIDNTKMSVQFDPSPRSGQEVVRIDNVSKSYGELNVLDQVSLTIHRKERVAFVGKNGEGKSTLTKIIMGLVKASGHITIGHNVQIGYYAQNQAETLDKELTVLQTIEQKSPPEKRTQLRNILGAFLFSKEDVDKKVSVLSGGERARLAMACMMLRPINFLVMDEPTNHLDIRSKDVLKKALLDYDGTLLVVSHDRDFLQSLTKHVIEFKDKHLRTYLGDIDYFLEKRKLENLRDVSLGKESSNSTLLPSNHSSEAVKNTPKSIDRQTQKQIAKIESKIDRKEKEVLEIENKMLQITDFSSQEYSDLQTRYNHLNQEIETLMQQWEEISD